MKGRRILYLLVWLVSLVFLLAYRQWLAWFALMAVLLLPVFSLVVSLPAMLTARLEVSVPESLTMGTPCPVKLRCKSVLPTPLWRYRLLVERPITGERRYLKPGQSLPTNHCGQLICTLQRVRIYDYLGLFSLPLRGCREFQVLVRPKPVAMEERALQTPKPANIWKPKAGGFAENHELRLYRPGDNVQQIHWKLSAKTGQLILREPMIPQPGRVLARLELRGSAEELDRMLGRLLWLGDRLLKLGIPFEIRCLTGDGVESMGVATANQLQEAVDALLKKPHAREGSLQNRTEAAAWQYDIGGEPDEG